MWNCSCILQILAQIFKLFFQEVVRKIYSLHFALLPFSKSWKAQQVHSTLYDRIKMSWRATHDEVQDFSQKKFLGSLQFTNFQNPKSQAKAAIILTWKKCYVNISKHVLGQMITAPPFNFNLPTFSVQSVGRLCY